MAPVSRKYWNWMELGPMAYFLAFLAAGFFAAGFFAAFFAAFFVAIVCHLL